MASLTPALNIFSSGVLTAADDDFTAPAASKVVRVEAGVADLYFSWESGGIAAGRYGIIKTGSAENLPVVGSSAGDVPSAVAAKLYLRSSAAATHRVIFWG